MAYHSFLAIFLVPDLCIPVLHQEHYIVFRDFVNDGLHLLIKDILCIIHGAYAWVVVVLIWHELNLAVMIRSFTGYQEIKQPATFLLNIMVTSLRCVSSSLPEYSRVSPVCVGIRPKPAHLYSLTPSTSMPYFLISLVTTAVFTILYIVLMFHVPIFMIDLGEANNLVTEQVSLRLTPVPIISPSSHMTKSSSGVRQVVVLLFEEELSVLVISSFLWDGRIGPMLNP